MQMTLIEKIIRSPYLHVIIGIIVGLYSRYYIDYIYETMRSGGLTPSLPFVHKDDHGNIRQTDVYIIPFAGFPAGSEATIAKYLSEYFDISVKETPVMPIPATAYDPIRKQYLVNNLYEPIYNFLPSLGQTKTNVLYIAILPGDMYIYDSSWNYTFCVGFEHNISIIATDRLVPFGVTDRKQAEELYGERLCKLLVRTVQEHYFGIPRSNDPTSVMFSPLMSVADIDNMRLPKKGI